MGLEIFFPVVPSKQPEYVRNYNRKYMLKRYENDPQRNSDCKQWMRDYITRKRIEDRDRLFEILGGARCQNPKCLVPGGCTDKRCLQFDHKDGDGYKIRKRFGSYHSMIQYYIIHLNEARHNLQVNCANCNWIKRHENKEYRKH